MFQRISPFVSVFLFFAFARTANAQPLQKDSIAQLRKFIIAQLKEQKVPGVSVVVMRNDTMLWEEGFGYADRERQRKVTSHTAFPVGSVTKTITMAGLMLLLNKNKINIDEPVNHLLKTIKVNPGNYNSDGLTIRRIGSHTSGLARYTYACFNDEQAACPSLPMLIKKFATPVRPAGESYEYSDLGYGVLAQLITNLSGTSYRRYISDAVFSPLKMKDSFIDTGFLKPSNAAISYTLSGKKLPPYYAPTLGEGAAYASARDIALFGMYLLDHKEDFYEMQTSQVVRAPGYSYGLAFHIYDNYGGYKVLLHHGHNGFATAAFFLVPEAKLCIAVTTNTSTSLPVDIGIKLFEYLLPRFDKKALIAESAKWESVTSPFKMDSLYLGEWEGNIMIDTAHVPIRLWFQQDGDVHVRIERQYRTLLNGIRMEDGYLRASFRSDLPSEDVKKYPYNLHLKLKLRENILDGSITASSFGTERTSVLSFPVRFVRK